MTTPGYTEGFTPSISIYKPDIDPSTGAYDVDDQYIETLTDKVETYQHSIEAVGGYWTAAFQINDTRQGIEWWIEEGLGKHIVVTDADLSIIWEGFVNRISASLGPLLLVRGPLFNASNRVHCVYGKVEDTPTLPPVVGTYEDTEAAEDADSQARYGIMQTAVTGSIATDVEAVELRNQYLAENAWPRTTQTVNIGRQPELSVKVECLGYVHWFSKYIYNQTAAVGPVNLDVKLQAVINAQLNGIIDVSMDEIEANATINVLQYENKDRTAWAIIQELVAYGNATDDRYLFGVYANQMPFYYEAPDDFEYRMRLAEPEQAIETMSGALVYPWNVLPGKWLQFIDLLAPRLESTTLRFDPRAMFIESVTYNAPWGLTMKGGDTDKLSQMIAKLGVYGLYNGPSIGVPIYLPPPRSGHPWSPAPGTAIGIG